PGRAYRDTQMVWQPVTCQWPNDDALLEQGFIDRLRWAPCIKGYEIGLTGQWHKAAVLQLFAQVLTLLAVDGNGTLQKIVIIDGSRGTVQSQAVDIERLAYTIQIVGHLRRG